MQIEDFMTYDFDVSHVKCLFVKGCTTSVKNKRDNYALHYYPEGGYNFHFDDGTVVKTGKNSVLFLPKGATYSIESLAPMDCYTMTFELSEPFPCKPFCVSVRDARYFLEMYTDTEKICRQAQSGHIMSSKAKLCAIIAALQHEYSLGYISSRKHSVITPAIELIHQCYTSCTPSVSELAEACGITPEYLRTLFKKKYGKSPLKYINDLRFSRARELLDSGLYTVTEVALLSGFSAASYFSKEFKKKYGVTPTGYVGESEEN